MKMQKIDSGLRNLCSSYSVHKRDLYFLRNYRFSEREIPLRCDSTPFSCGSCQGKNEEDYNDEIQVRSEIGKGTEITVLLSQDLNKRG